MSKFVSILKTILKVVLTFSVTMILYLLLITLNIKYGRCSCGAFEVSCRFCDVALGMPHSIFDCLMDYLYETIGFYFPTGYLIVFFFIVVEVLSIKWVFRKKKRKDYVENSVESE